MLQVRNPYISAFLNYFIFLVKKKSPKQFWTRSSRRIILFYPPPPFLVNILETSLLATASSLIIEILYGCGGNWRHLPNTLCHITKIDKNNFNIISLYIRVGKTVTHLKDYYKKHYGNGNKFKDYMKKFFSFPFPSL